MDETEQQEQSDWRKPHAREKHSGEESKEPDLQRLDFVKVRRLPFADVLDHIFAAEYAHS